MKNKSRWLLAAGLFLAAVMIGVGGSLWVITSSSIPIMQSTEIGAAGPIKIEFDEQMRVDSVEQRIDIKPADNYRLEWRSNRLLIWPQTRWQAGEEINIAINKGSRTTDNRVIRQIFTNSVQVHAAEILYLSPAMDASQVWKYQLGGGGAGFLDPVSGGVEISPSGDGSKFIVSRLNGDGGADLWTLSRDGGAEIQLVNCGATWCGELSWQPGESRFAYSQYQNKGRGAPRIYTYDFETGTSNPVMTDPTILASHPVFSPEGFYLAFYNSSQNGIAILDVRTSEMQILQTAMEQAVTWLPDSSGFLFLHSLALEGIPIEKVFRYDLSTRSSSIAVGTEDDALSYEQPAISYDGKWIAVPVRQVEGGFSSQIWLFDGQGNEIQAITDEPEYTHGGLTWSPDGQTLLFQRLKANDSPPMPDVLTWNIQTNRTQIIAGNANGAEWLP